MIYLLYVNTSSDVILKQAYHIYFTDEETEALESKEHDQN